MLPFLEWAGGSCQLAVILVEETAFKVKLIGACEGTEIQWIKDQRTNKIRTIFNSSIFLLFCEILWALRGVRETCTYTEDVSTNSITIVINIIGNLSRVIFERRTSTPKRHFPFNSSQSEAKVLAVRVISSCARSARTTRGLRVVLAAYKLGWPLYISIFLWVYPMVAALTSSTVWCH